MSEGGATMDLVFSTDGIERSKRYAAWQGAICDVYVHVDVASNDRSDYEGFIREAHFGAVTVTDVLLSEQHISRRSRHIAKLDKDCYYVEFVEYGIAPVLKVLRFYRCWCRHDPCNPAEPWLNPAQSGNFTGPASW